MGAHLSSGVLSHYRTILMMISAFLVCATGNIINDILDIEADRINHPQRVLVKKIISPTYAWKLAITLGSSSLIVIFFTDFVLLAIVAVSLVLLLLYNYIFKNIPLVGNVVLSLLASALLLSGAVSANPHNFYLFPGAFVAAVFAFFIHLIRELIKDVQDMEGDQRSGFQTLPIKIGVRYTTSLIVLLQIILTILSIFPLVLGWYGIYYHIIAVYLVNLPLLIIAVIVQLKTEPKQLKLASQTYKAGMVLGLIALFLG